MNTKTILHLAVMSVNENGTLVAILRQQGLLDRAKLEPIQETTVRNFTVSGECKEGEIPADCLLRLLREQLGILPSHFILDWEAKPFSFYPIFLGGDLHFGNKRFFYAVRVDGKKFIENVRIVGGTGDLCIETEETVPLSIWTFASDTDEVTADSNGPKALKFAFQLFDSVI